MRVRVRRTQLVFVPQHDGFELLADDFHFEARGHVASGDEVLDVRVDVLGVASKTVVPGGSGDVSLRRLPSLPECHLLERAGQDEREIARHHQE